jgi:hypothetical protein
MGIKLSSLNTTRPLNRSRLIHDQDANNFLPPSHFRLKALLKLEPRLFDVGARDLTDWFVSSVPYSRFTGAWTTCEAYSGCMLFDGRGAIVESGRAFLSLPELDGVDFDSCPEA